LNAMLAIMKEQPYGMSIAFLTSLAEQLHEEEDALARLQQWIEENLHKPLTAIVREEHAREAAQSVSTARAFGSLRTLARLEFSKVFEAVSLVDVELRKDPGGIYARSDFTTRDACRRQVERIARSGPLNEWDLARVVVGLAEAAPEPQDRHVT